MVAMVLVQLCKSTTVWVVDKLRVVCCELQAVLVDAFKASPARASLGSFCVSLLLGGICMPTGVLGLCSLRRVFEPGFSDAGDASC